MKKPLDYENCHFAQAPSSLECVRHSAGRVHRILVEPTCLILERATEPRPRPLAQFVLVLVFEHAGTDTFRPAQIPVRVPTLRLIRQAHSERSVLRPASA